MTQISIYILHTLPTHMMYSLLYNYLPFTCTSLTILHKTYLEHTFISTLNLIFNSQSHIILSLAFEKILKIEKLTGKKLILPKYAPF